MTLDNEEGRPGESGLLKDQAGGRVTDRVTRPSYLVLAEMVADSADRERVIFERAWSAGYPVGFEAGQEVGYRRAVAEMERAWSEVAAQVRALGSPSSLPADELELRRWDGPRSDFGRPRPGDYMGGPVRWKRETAA